MPSARDVSLAIAAGRVAIGIGTLAAPAPALRVLGFERPDSAGEALARIAGARDIGLGLIALAARRDPFALRAATATGAGVDAADAIVFATASRRPGMRRAGLGGAAAGGAAALAGLWAWRHLGRGG